MGLNPEQQNELCDIDDSLAYLDRERGRGIDWQLVQDVTTETPEWVRACRKEYLNQEIPRLRAEILDSKAQTGKMIMTSGDDPDFLLAFFDESKKINILKIIENEYMQKSILNYKNIITQEQIEQARSYPLWKYLDKKQKDKITCPFHPDKTPSLHLYALSGFCFTCSKKVDSIEYTMRTRGIDFISAVKMLLGRP